MRLSEVWRNDWTGGWTSLVLLGVNNIQYLLSYKNESGIAASDQINDTFHLIEDWRDTWTAGWTSLVPLQVNGKQHLLSYKSGAGTAALDRIDPS